MKQTIGALAVYGVLCGWIQVFSPPGKLKKSVTFALGVLLTVTIVQSLSGFLRDSVREAFHQTQDWQTLSDWDAADSGGLGASYARQAVRSIAGRDSDCTVTFDARGEPLSIVVTLALQDDADLFSQALQNKKAEQTRERIIQTLCGIYGIERDAIVFL